MKNRYLIGTLTGMAIGVFVLHPFSMAFQGLIHPAPDIRLFSITDAFNVHHLPMAFFFGVLGGIFGLTTTYNVIKLSREQERVKHLESLLPVCAYCRKIRDDEGKIKGEGCWYHADKYLEMKTDTEFTHGICPECYERVMEEELEEDNSVQKENPTKVLART
jgi:hypothetical protein